MAADMERERDWDWVNVRVEYLCSIVTSVCAISCMLLNVKYLHCFHLKKKRSQQRGSNFVKNMLCRQCSKLYLEVLHRVRCFCVTSFCRAIEWRRPLIFTCKYTSSQYISIVLIFFFCVAVLFPSMILYFYFKQCKRYLLLRKLQVMFLPKYIYLNGSKVLHTLTRQSDKTPFDCHLILCHICTIIAYVLEWMDCICCFS